MRYLCGQEALQHVADVDQGYVLQRLPFKLTSAQLLAIFTTAVTLTAKPGANRTIIPVRVNFYKPAGVAYTIGAFTGFDFKYAAGTVLFTTDATPITGAGAVRTMHQAAIANVAVTENVAVAIQGKIADPTVGDQALYGELFYHILNSTLPSSGKL